MPLNPKVYVFVSNYHVSSKFCGLNFMNVLGSTMVGYLYIAPCRPSRPLFGKQFPWSPLWGRPMLSQPCLRSIRICSKEHSWITWTTIWHLLRLTWVEWQIWLDEICIDMSPIQHNLAQLWQPLDCSGATCQSSSSSWMSLVSSSELMSL